jgi:hypothetical protein
LGFYRARRAGGECWPRIDWRRERDSNLRYHLIYQAVPSDICNHGVTTEPTLFFDAYLASLMPGPAEPLCASRLRGRRPECAHDQFPVVSFLERAKGFEPSTPTLASESSARLVSTPHFTLIPHNPLGCILLRRAESAAFLESSAPHCTPAHTKRGRRLQPNRNRLAAAAISRFQIASQTTRILILKEVLSELSLLADGSCIAARP